MDCEEVAGLGSPHLPHSFPIIGGSCHKYHFCHDKCVCHNKHMFVMTKSLFCHDKSMLVVTKLLLQQAFDKCVCHDKHIKTCVLS